MIIDLAGPAVIDEIVKHLRKGELAAIPTETVYGLVADASNALAVEKIFMLKGRASDKPLSILIPDAGALTRWADNIPQYAYQLAEKFWPGPLTLILPKAAHVDPHLGTEKTIGLRVPNHPVALEILAAFRGGLAAPSANPSGERAPTSAAEVAKYFPEGLWIVDGGPTHFGLASTVVDCCAPKPVILREGAISQNALFS